MQSNECLQEIKEETTEIKQTIDQLRDQHKHWDQAHKQYHIDNYRYIDCHGVLHEKMVHYIDDLGRTQETPLQYMA